MEDISRELEREIARAKPTPHKTNRKKNILVVNDFGEMSSGRYLSVLVRCLTVTSLVFGMAAAGLYYLYNGQSQKVASMEKRLTMLEKKKNQLTNEKEILMARLVMSGEKPVLGQVDSAIGPGQIAKTKTKKTEAKLAKQEPAETQQSSLGGVEKTPAAAPLAPAVQPSVGSPTLSVDERLDAATAANADHAEAKDREDQAETGKSKVIAVEKFSVSQSPDNEELRVNFNIRNIKEGSGMISGRIFLVLKPEGGGEDDWIVAPKAPLSEEGIPSVYKRGQYFSISRFKPVKFTVDSKVLPQRLKMTGVFIFDDQGQLIFNEMVETHLGEDE